MTITVDIKPEVQAELERQRPKRAARSRPMLRACSKRLSVCLLA
jgi:hypothetical protein